jgi:DNA polymerase-1
VARPRLLLLDGHSLAYRAFYALPVDNFATSTGQATNAVYGFTSMLINLLRDEQPTHVAVAFDVSRKTFRSERFPEYKANRAKTPDEFRDQVPLIKEVLAAMGIPALEVEGFEADDIIATLATQAEPEFDVLICTGDRDTFQLVSDHTTVLYPRKGVSDLARMTPDAVQEKYGLRPEQYPDFAALRGDPSDNLPGIPGVGEKTATKWIVEHGSLAALVAAADRVGGKVGESLRENLAQVIQNRELTELVREVPLAVAPPELARADMDPEAVHAIFDALQFRVLRERLAPMLGGASAPVAAEVPRAELVTDVVSDWSTWLDRHAASGNTGVAVAASGIAFATADDAHAFAPFPLGPADRASIAAWLGDATLPKVLHDAKAAMHLLATQDLPLAGLAGDTAIAAYLVLPGQRSLDLSDLSEKFLGRGVAVEAREEDQGALDFGGAQAEGLIVRARATIDLHEQLGAQLSERGAETLYREVELPLASMLFVVESAGIAVDRDGLAALESRFAVNAKEAAESAYRSVGHEFNLGSPKQLQTVLFEELGLPKTKKIKTGYTTDAESLTALAVSNPHPVLESILRHRDMTKLRTTIEGLQRSIAADGRIHTTFQQTVAATGRLSSTDPNLQNIPVRSEEGRLIRQCFVVGDGFESLMTADYSQIEMRIMAHLSADAGLLAAFASGEDLHTTVAASVFAVPRDGVTPEMRRRIKAMSYGLAYGLSSYGLSQQLGISDGEARDLMASYFERFGGVRDYLRAVVEQARRDGYTETLLGRRRYLPDLTSDNRQRREIAERMALNAPIQGSAADIVKVAMLRVQRALEHEARRSRVLLQVHDELVLEVAPGEREDVEVLVRREMADAYPLDAALEVSVGFGRSWDEAAH